MNKKRIIFLVILTLFCSTLTFTEENVLDKFYKQKEIDYKLEALFNAIKIFNNRYALSFLETNEAKETTTNLLEYGPRLEEIEDNDVSERLININIKNSYGYSPLIVAIEYNNEIITSKLLEMGVDTDISHPVLGKSILNTAVFYENYNIVKLLIDYDKSLVNKSDKKDGFTPLMDAVLKANKSIIKLLLENGADPLQKDYKGYTALDLAVEFGKGEIVKMLKDHIRKFKEE